MRVEETYEAAELHSVPLLPIVWCRYGIMIGSYVCIWWGKWGHFLATMKLTSLQPGVYELTSHSERAYWTLASAVRADWEGTRLREERDDAREEIPFG